MKRLLFIFLTVSCALSAQRQTQTTAEDGYGLFISGGIPVSIWGAIANTKTPYNITIDKLFMSDHVIGVGYTREELSRGIYSGTAMIRENLRLRICGYLNDPRGNFSTYLGAAGGVTIWKARDSGDFFRKTTVPSIQVLYGMKLELTASLYWLNEVALGAPYFLHTAVGIEF
jgi:hypothetical protein